MDTGSIMQYEGSIEEGQSAIYFWLNEFNAHEAHSTSTYAVTHMSSFGSLDWFPIFQMNKRYGSEATYTTIKFYVFLS